MRSSVRDECCFLLFAGQRFENDRRLQTAAESDVNEPSSIVIRHLYDEHQVIRMRLRPALCPHYRRCRSLHVEPDRLERPAEEPVLLITPAPTSSTYNLVVGFVDGGGQRPAQLNVEIFERNGVTVRLQEILQQIDSWRSIALPANPLKIAV